MADDLVERLRAKADELFEADGNLDLLLIEAGGRIEALEKQVRELSIADYGVMGVFMRAPPPAGDE